MSRISTSVTGTTDDMWDGKKQQVWLTSGPVFTSRGLQAVDVIGSFLENVFVIKLVWETFSVLPPSSDA